MEIVRHLPALMRQAVKAESNAVHINMQTGEGTASHAHTAGVGEGSSWFLAGTEIPPHVSSLWLELPSHVVSWACVNVVLNVHCLYQASGFVMLSAEVFTVVLLAQPLWSLQLVHLVLEQEGERFSPEILSWVWSFLAFSSWFCAALIFGLFVWVFFPLPTPSLPFPFLCCQESVLCSLHCWEHPGAVPRAKGIWQAFGPTYSVHPAGPLSSF